MGKLIVLEGTDGSGKATQTAALLERWLLMLKEQGEDTAFAQIRKELQDPNY